MPEYFLQELTIQKREAGGQLGHMVEGEDADRGRVFGVQYSFEATSEIRLHCHGANTQIIGLTLAETFQLGAP